MSGINHHHHSKPCGSYRQQAPDRCIDYSTTLHDIVQTDNCKWFAAQLHAWTCLGDAPTTWGPGKTAEELGSFRRVRLHFMCFFEGPSVSKLAGRSSHQRWHLCEPISPFVVCLGHCQRRHHSQRPWHWNHWCLEAKVWQKRHWLPTCWRYTAIKDPWIKRGHPLDFELLWTHVNPM